MDLILSYRLWCLELCKKPLLYSLMGLCVLGLYIYQEMLAHLSECAAVIENYICEGVCPQHIISIIKITVDSVVAGTVLDCGTERHYPGPVIGLVAVGADVATPAVADCRGGVGIVRPNIDRLPLTGNH